MTICIFSYYGYKAFQVGAINYLLKPFSEDNIIELLDSLEKTHATHLKIDEESINNKKIKEEQIKELEELKELREDIDKIKKELNK